jgi:HlyD family secretion protein
MIREPTATDRPLARAAGSRALRRWLTLGVIASAILAGAVLVAARWLDGARSYDRASVRISEVERGTLVRDVVADGRVVAASSPTLYAIAAGTVELHVQPGDAVTRDQALVTVASPELQSRLAQEQATLAGLEAEAGRAALEVEQGRADAQKVIDQVQVDLTAAQRELAGARQVYEDGALSEIELRRAEDAVSKAEIALAHARNDARLEKKGLAFDVSTRKQAVDRQRAVVTDLARQVDELVIRSPVDGIVGQLLVAQRASVAANTPILTVVDLSAHELEIRVPDSFARDLATGMTAEIRAGNAVFTGRVRSVSPEVVDGHVSSRLVFVGDKPEGLRQNQRLTARILIEERPDVVMIERGPFLESGGGHSAYFVEGDVAERRTIRTGAVSLDAVEILEGAEVGDRIVVSGADAFGDAERVRIAD